MRFPKSIEELEKSISPTEEQYCLFNKLLIQKNSADWLNLHILPPKNLYEMRQWINELAALPNHEREIK